MARPKIICMCGSTKFADLMAAISWEFEKQRNIVLRVNYVPYWMVKHEGWTESSHGAEQSGLKAQLDELHCRKIDLCDEVFVCNPFDYIGESTTNEINYANSVNKPVTFMGDTRFVEIFKSWIKSRISDIQSERVALLDQHGFFGGGPQMNKVFAQLNHQEDSLRAKLETLNNSIEPN